MNKQLWGRLARLEERLNPESMSPLIVVTEALPSERKVGLTVSQRVEQKTFCIINSGL